MNSNPNMTLTEFVQRVGPIEPNEWQRQFIAELADEPEQFRYLMLLPRRVVVKRPENTLQMYGSGSLRRRPVSGGMEKDCVTGEVHEPLLERDQTSDPWSKR